MIKTVAVVGVGLIGGSFALALRRIGFLGRIVGVDLPHVIAGAVVSRIVEEGVTLEEAAKIADLLYLAQPVDQILATVPRLGSLVAPGALITDAGSTKTLIAESAAKYMVRGCFLGGHPLAGKEKRGFAFADPDLFQDRPYVLIPAIGTSGHQPELRSWLANMGARLIDLTAAQHDETVALTSHLPQILSTVLSSLLEKSANPDTLRVFGPGLLDMTRLALSAPEVWLGVLRTNKMPVQAALAEFRQELAALENALGTENLEECFRIGALYSKKLRQD